MDIYNYIENINDESASWVMDHSWCDKHENDPAETKWFRDISLVFLNETKELILNEMSSRQSWVSFHQFNGWQVSFSLNIQQRCIDCLINWPLSMSSLGNGWDEFLHTWEITNTCGERNWLQLDQKSNSWKYSNLLNKVLNSLADDELSSADSSIHGFTVHMLKCPWTRQWPHIVPDVFTGV